jgi:hypothetical protein
MDRKNETFHYHIRWARIRLWTGNASVHVWALRRVRNNWYAKARLTLLRNMAKCVHVHDAGMPRKRNPRTALHKPIENQSDADAAIYRRLSLDCVLKTHRNDSLHN